MTTKKTATKPSQPKAVVHFPMQGKGGIGKSFATSLLAQFYKKQGRNQVCYDTDPINKTFAGYQELKVQKFELGERADEINPRSFDKLMEAILTIEEDTQFVIDVGSGTYLPLISYMVENEVVEILKDAGHEIMFHAVLIGGQAYNDTIEGLEKLFKYFPDTKTVVWLNEFFGVVVSEQNPVVFEETPVCTQNEDKIHAVIALPHLRKETFGEDIKTMMTKHLTFDQAIKDETFSIMSRQRLKSVSKTIFETMDMAAL